MEVSFTSASALMLVEPDCNVKEAGRAAEIRKNYPH